MATKFLEPGHEIYLVFLTHMEMDEPLNYGGPILNVSSKCPYFLNKF